MSLDTMFFVGVIIVLLMMPRVFAARIAKRSAIPALFVMLCGAIMVLYPVLQEPGYYTPQKFAEMVITKVANLLN